MTKYHTKKIIGDCTLYHGDCMDILPTLGQVDAVVTDPPYGIGAAEGFSGKRGFSGKEGFSAPIERRRYAGSWDDEKPNIRIIEEMNCDKIVWGGNYFTDQLSQGNFWLFWDKQNTMPTHSDGEMAWTNLPRKSVKRLTYLQNGCMSKEKARYHPTQKPVGVMKWCLEFIVPEKTILDPFMGSGTTGVACAKMGRKFIGIELDKEYFDIACKRIEEAYSQPDMFVEQPKEMKQESLLDG